LIHFVGFFLRNCSSESLFRLDSFFFETNQVITGEEEEGLNDSVVTLLVSYICCGADTRAFIQISRRSFLIYGYYLQATVVMWDMGHW